MSRATLLPTPGDPFLIQEWLRHWRTWGGVGGQLYVGVSWEQPDDVVEYIRRDVESIGSVLAYDEFFSQHGGNLRRLIDLVAEEFVLFMEDDFYARSPSHVDALFREVEQGRVDVIGSPRGNGTQELQDACRARGWPGTGMWPHMVFSRTEELRSLTQTFESPVWEAGETIVGLDYQCQEFCCADTFHAAALELWGRPGLRFADANVPEGSARGYWFHIGSLSSGPYLRHAAIEEITAQAWNWAPRAAWWGLCADRWAGGLDERHATYREQVRVIGDAVGWDKVDVFRRQFERSLLW